MANNQPIGIFDSGVGGLTIMLALKQVLPREYFYYLADQKNCPYGTRNEQEIQKLVRQGVTSLIKKGCKLIVIACNTATVTSINLLRSEFPKIPFVGVVPPVKLGAQLSLTGHFVILSTKATQQSKYLNDLIKKYASSMMVYSLAVPHLVELIEEGEIQGPKVSTLIKKSIQPALADAQIDLVATGCTHYPLVKTEIVKLFSRRIKFIEPSLAVAKQVKRILLKENLINRQKNQKQVDKFFTTSKAKTFKFPRCGLDFTWEVQ